MWGARGRTRRSRLVFRIARFPPTTDVNPYQPLLHEHLAALGYPLVGEPEFRREYGPGPDVGAHERERQLSITQT
jgi:hypothetical protein